MRTLFEQWKLCEEDSITMLDLFDLSGSKLLFWPGSDKLFSLHNIENIWIMFLIFYKLFSFLIFYKLFSFLTMIVASCRSPILSTPLSHGKVGFEIK